MICLLFRISFLLSEFISMPFIRSPIPLSTTWIFPSEDSDGAIWIRSVRGSDSDTESCLFSPWSSFNKITLCTIRSIRYPMSSSTFVSIWISSAATSGWIPAPSQADVTLFNTRFRIERSVYFIYSFCFPGFRSSCNCLICSCSFRTSPARSSICT